MFREANQAKPPLCPPARFRNRPRWMPADAARLPPTQNPPKAEPFGPRRRAKAMTSRILWLRWPSGVTIPQCNRFTWPKVLSRSSVTGYSRPPGMNRTFVSRVSALLASIFLISTTTVSGATSVAQADEIPSVAGVIDSPTTGATLSAGQPFTINGWLVDRSTDTNVGVDAIGATAMQPGQQPIELGQARLALARPDVAAA